jgi:transposase-like protein
MNQPTTKTTNKTEVLAYAAEHTVAKAAEKFGVTAKTIYVWQNTGCNKESGVVKKEGMSIETEGDYLVIRVPKKMALREVLGGMI